MIGYIYKTTNLINNKVYIGKHEVSEYDTSYFGSGKTLLKAIKKYGKENFKNEVLYEAETIEELNKKEIEFISQYKDKLGKNCYNIANGGDGGDTTRHMEEKQKKEFVSKMTQINRERCGTNEFKNKTGERMRKKYEDPEERSKQSERIKEAWSDLKLREKHSKRIKEWYKTHKIDHAYAYKPCYIVKPDEEVIQFESRKQCDEYFRENFGVRSMPKSMENGKPYIAFHKKNKSMEGIAFSYGVYEEV